MNSKIKRIIGGTFIAGALLGGGAAIGVGTASAACMGSGVDDVSGAPCGSSSSGGGNAHSINPYHYDRSVPLYNDDGSVKRWTYEGSNRDESYGDAADRANERGYGNPGYGNPNVS